MLRSAMARTLWAARAEAWALRLTEKPPLVEGGDIATKLVSNSARCPAEQRRCLGVSMAVQRSLTRKEILASVSKPDEGTEGEKTVDIDSNVRESAGMFPDENTPNLLYDGVRFADLPILHIKTTKNNTIMSITSAKGDIQMTHTCGMEGFKNTRKGTNVAAQATAISFAQKIAGRGIKNVRVKVKGLGPGRMSAVKGSVMGGLNVVSITDSTVIDFFDGQRPRKAKKL